MLCFPCFMILKSIYFCVVCWNRVSKPFCLCFKNVFTVYVTTVLVSYMLNSFLKYLGLNQKNSNRDHSSTVFSYIVWGSENGVVGAEIHQDLLVGPFWIKCLNCWIIPMGRMAMISLLLIKKWPEASAVRRYCRTMVCQEDSFTASRLTSNCGTTLVPR